LSRRLPRPRFRPPSTTRSLNQRTPYDITWNLIIQRELLKNLALEVGYLGKSSSRVERDIQFNQPAPRPGRHPAPPAVLPASATERFATMDQKPATTRCRPNLKSGTRTA
jgi:hypothetical protein